MTRRNHFFNFSSVLDSFAERILWTAQDLYLSSDATLGAVKFIGLLLLMAGVESNPGPNHGDKAVSFQTFARPTVSLLSESSFQAGEPKLPGAQDRFRKACVSERHDSFASV